MRQAGRFLPEYRALRAKVGTVLDLAYAPKLAAEATLQPIRRFGLDAAILFSDILVVPDAMNQKVSFVEGEGPRLEALGGPEGLERLAGESWCAPRDAASGATRRPASRWRSSRVASWCSNPRTSSWRASIATSTIAEKPRGLSRRG